MKRFILVIAMVGIVVVLGAKENGMGDLKTVEYVDISRYLGTWYEIARYPNPFEKNCVGVTATYSLREDGRLKVVNSCIKKTLDGKEKLAKGKAWVVDKETNSKLKVQFFWPFSGDYWIMELGPEYEYAVIGDPDRKYFWILARDPVMDEGLYQGILARAQEQGYDPARVMKTLQR